LEEDNMLAWRSLPCFIANELQLNAKCLLRSDGLISRWFTVVLIFAVLFCGALASNPGLHRLIHPNAGDVHHECAVTIFAHGKVNAMDGNPVVATPIFSAFPVDASFHKVVLVSCDYLLLPGRAPPRLST
jgi:hypothetical protein